MRRLIAALFIAVLLAPASPTRAQSPAKPAYVLEAERNYRAARDELLAAQNALALIKQNEARRSRLAMRRRGQWIEPSTLWHEKLAAQQRLAFAQQGFQQSSAELNSARDAARRARIGSVPQPEPLSTPFWELW